MKLEKNSLNPNCSEAVMRIRTDRLCDEDRSTIVNILTDVIKDKYGENNFDTNISESVIFGIDIITVDGDAPYRYPDELEAALNDFDVDIEFS